MRRSSSLPPGFGVDPAELGSSTSTADQSLRLSAAAPNTDKPLGSTATEGVRPTLWIGSDGREEDDGDVNTTGPASPGNFLVTAACMGIALAALAYALDFPLS